MRFNTAILMIEGGKALEMVKAHIEERKAANASVRALLKEIGAENGFTSRTTGVLTGVVFEKEIHPDFRKPKRRDGCSYPKKGSDWEKRLAEQKGYRDPAAWISEEFGIPLSINVKREGDKEATGWRCIGSPLTECGFLFLTESGPYAMWVPDVPLEVAQEKAGGYEVLEPAASFKLDFEGCRRIPREEWDYLVAKFKLEQKQREAA